MRSTFTVASLCAGLGLAVFSPAASAFQLQLAEDLQISPTSPPSGHQFGVSLGLENDTLLVGAQDNVSAGPGFVSAYHFDGSTWTLQQEFTRPGGAPGDVFGRRLALDGERALISARSTAFVYARTGLTWSVEQEIPPSGTSSTTYGSDVDLDGDTAVVGDYGMTQARVFVWLKSGATWSVQQELQPVGAAGSGFGRTVAIVGDTLFVGAPFDDQAANDAGAVFVYTRSGTTWTQATKIFGAPATPGIRLGGALDAEPLPGGLVRLAVGTSSGNGRVFVFEGSGALWSQTANLMPMSGGPQGWFGAAVSLSGDRLAVGAWNGTLGSGNSGMGTVYRRSGASWVRQTDLLSTNAAAGDQLGAAVALEGETVVLGATQQDDQAPNAGAAYVFELEDSTLQTFCHGDGSGAPCPCANDAPGGTDGGCLNSSATGALAITNDLVQVSNDKFNAFASDLLPGQPGLLFAGTEALNGGSGFGFGDGLRCAGTNVLRLGTETPDLNGDASWGPGLHALGGWGPGDTRFFQVWYRDPVGGPCGSGFNLTNGVQLTFEP